MIYLGLLSAQTNWTCSVCGFVHTVANIASLVSFPSYMVLSNHHFCTSRLTLVSIMACCGPSVEPAFSTEQYYSHNLLSREECDKIRFMSEFTCTKTASFRPDGKVTMLLGGSDVLSTGTYQRKGKKIIVNQEYTARQAVTFEVVSDTTLKRIETGDIWAKN